MLHRTPSGCCERDIGASKAHVPQHCDHGELLHYTKALGSNGRNPLNRVSPNNHTNRVEKRRGSTKRSQPKRDWTYARAKVEQEGCCRVCGSCSHVEAAHVIGRKHDEPTSPGSGLLFVKPERIVPLCGPFPDGCHGAYDHKRLDLLSYLSASEQAQAVEDAGGIEEARRRLLPVSFEPVTEVAA